MLDMTSRLAVPVSARDHQEGPAVAPVTLVEYGDYECPNCGQAFPIVQAIRRDMGDQLRFVFRNFPLTQIHPYAEHAAEAAEAAGAQGKFWPYHDMLFLHQDALTDSDLIGYAADLGLDVARFTRDLEDGAFAERVREDFLSGVRSGVNGTPTFFINSYRYDGSYDYDTLLAALQEAAAQATAG